MAFFGRSKKREDVDAVTVPTPEVADPGPRHRTVDQQRDFLLGSVRALSPFGVQVLDVDGLTLCEDIVSDLDLPPVTTALEEGYGVRAANIVGASSGHPIDLRLVAAVKPGDPTPRPLPGGATVFLEEGAPVPDGVDAIVEEAAGRLRGRHVLFTAEARVGGQLQPRGSELRDGSPLLPAGEVLNPRSSALLAEVGLDKVLVRPRPRLVVMCVDGSLVAPGRPLTAPNQRYDSTTALLTAAARRDGATVYPVGVVEPTASGMRQAIVDQAIRADLILVVGGSADEAELVTGVLRDLGSVDVADVPVNGGTRYGLGRVGEEGVPVVLLPGGAVGAFVGYHAFVRAMIGRLNDREPDAAPRRWATLAADIDSVSETVRYVPAVLAGGAVRPVSSAGGGSAHDLYRANALLILPRGRVRNGWDVECLVLDAVASGRSDAGEGS